MRCVRSFAAPLLVVVVVLGAPARLFAATLCESSLPSNIDAGILEPIAIALLQQSSTFRQQCQRIASTVVLRVRVRLVPALQAGSRGETVIQRYETGALRADVRLGFGSDYMELLPHEFEHVIEQVERVNLVRQHATGHAWMTSDGAFETQRAIDVGVRARHECELSAVEAVEADRRPSPRLRDKFE